MLNFLFFPIIKFLSRTYFVTLWKCVVVFSIRSEDCFSGCNDVPVTLIDSGFEFIHSNAMSNLTSEMSHIILECLMSPLKYPNYH